MVKLFYWCGELDEVSFYLLAMVVDVSFYLTLQACAFFRTALAPLNMLSLLFVTFMLVFGLICLAYFFAHRTFHTELHCAYFTCKLAVLSLSALGQLLAFAMKPQDGLTLLLGSLPLALQLYWSWALRRIIRENLPHSHVSFKPLPSNDIENLTPE